MLCDLSSSVYISDQLYHLQVRIGVLKHLGDFIKVSLR